MMLKRLIGVMLAALVVQWASQWIFSLGIPYEPWSAEDEEARLRREAGCCSLLDITANVTKEEIRKAFRLLSPLYSTEVCTMSPFMRVDII